MYCAHQAIGDEPFLLMLGDHLYHSHGERSCAQQMIDAYQFYGINILGLRRTPEAEISNFGTIAGVWIEPEQY